MTELQRVQTEKEEAHRAALDESRARHEAAMAAERDRHSSALVDLEELQNSERDTLVKSHDLLAAEVESQKTLVARANADREHDRQAHQTDVDDLKTRLATMEQHLQSVMTERASYASQVEELKSELDCTKKEQSSLIQEASKRDSLTQELEHHRSVLAEMQNDLQRVKDEKDNLVAEKQRQDVLMKELQAQVAQSTLMHRRDGSGDSAPSLAALGPRSRPNGLPPAKLPPLTPPPSVPPPPLPTAPMPDTSVSSHTTRTSTSSQSSRAPSPDEQTTPSTSVMMSPTTPQIDSKIAALIEEQAKHLEEQESMIKTLNKQLTHCEADLQAHMDLVATLEASLTDSERNRKFLRSSRCLLRC